VQVLIVRHAAAVPSGTSGIGEAERPLTPEGRAKFEVAARGLARLLDAPEVLLSSPLKRARQTAEIAAEAWGGQPVLFDAALAGEDLDAIDRLLGRQARDSCVALFGHEPTVSALLARLLGLDNAEAVAFKKGAAALVETSDPAASGSGQLVWFLSPGALRSLGGED
jgi:phosphohistidine phosphatase